MGNVDLTNGLIGMLDVLLIPVAVVLLWLILSALRRVERAAWAIVSQLQAARREEHAPVLAPFEKAAQAVEPFTGSVKQSMFGR